MLLKSLSPLLQFLSMDCPPLHPGRILRWDMMFFTILSDNLFGSLLIMSQ
jgi:hypothetical protein